MPAVAMKPAVLQVAPPRYDLPSPTSFYGLPTAPYQAINASSPKAWGGVLEGTVFRGVLIGGGLFAVGVRKPTQLVAGAFLASVTLTLLNLVSHASRAA